MFIKKLLKKKVNTYDLQVFMKERYNELNRKFYLKIMLESAPAIGYL